jgi:hypothetical protein
MCGMRQWDVSLRFGNGGAVLRPHLSARTVTAVPDQGQAGEPSHAQDGSLAAELLPVTAERCSV